MFGKKEEIKDLKPEYRKRRKEPVLPWGKKERLIILASLLITVLVSVFFSFSSGNFAVPKFSDFNLDNIFKGETVIIGNKAAVEKAVRNKKAEKIIAEFKSKTDNLKGIYAFEVIDLSDGFRFGVNQDKVMQAASLIKLPLMLYAQGKVDDAKLEAMGKRSDNNVFNELVAKFGKTTVQNYIGSLGMKNTSLGENLTTPSEIGDIFFKLYRDKNEKILNFLTDTIFEKWLRVGIPEKIRMAHKYGREQGVVNDAGIIYSKEPFILIIMTQGVDEIEADRLIPELAKMIYSEYAESQDIH
ncbi:MAG: serine hydrolase [Patescibacteria group bacterium]